jgi:dihydroorotase
MIFSNRIAEGDILIDSGRFERVGGVIDADGADEIDGTGLFALPGVIDAHVHFREPGPTHKECIRTGSAAAARGGVTSFIEMPNTSPPTVNQARLDEKKQIAKATSAIHYGFFVGASADNIEDLKSITGAAGIKIYAGSSTGTLLVDDQAVLERIFAETTLPIGAHCEDETTIRANTAELAGAADPAIHSRIRTAEAAAMSIERLSELAVRHRHPLHVLHVSSTAELDVMPDDPIVSAEICVPHLFFDVEAYEPFGNLVVINPAIRPSEQREAMWEALTEGRFRTLGTDHAPHTVDEKLVPYPGAPSGMPSVENALALMLDAHNNDRISLLDIVRLMSAAPAEVWGIPNKGRIEEGWDADLVLVDLDLEREVRDEHQWSRCGWSPWDGLTLKGWPVRTMLLGDTVYETDQLVGEPRGQALTFER